VGGSHEHNLFCLRSCCTHFEGGDEGGDRP
jgi:hypothetical protein